jgi:pterin-4a-carbinolamine dehydratase
METMETKLEEVATQESVTELGLDGVRLPPRPPDGQPLKATSVQQRLKAERVQDALKVLPGWRLTSGTKAIDRVYSFATAALASAYTGYVTEAARLAEMPVDLSVAGATVVVTLSAPLRGGGHGVTESVLNFAKQLR